MALNRESKILLVDDSPAILALLRDMLKARGFSRVRTATSVEEGLKMLEEEAPDVVFLDLMMPESSGLEFTKAALATHPTVRIVLTTALPPTSEPVMMAISQGAAEYLQKPLRPDSLATVIDHLRRTEDGSYPSYHG